METKKAPLWAAGRGNNGLKTTGELPINLTADRKGRWLNPFHGITGTIKFEHCGVVGHNSHVLDGIILNIIQKTLSGDTLFFLFGSNDIGDPAGIGLALCG